MQKISENHTFMGMQRDLSVSKQPIQFLYDAKNIRLTAREDDSLLSITNEKGTESTDFSVNGTYLGHCLLNNYLVVFSKGTQNDYITRIDLSAPFNNDATDSIADNPIILYEGNLGFSLSNPIKAIGSYETETVQKVYWTDDINQPRVINIANIDQSTLSSYNEYSFDFVPTLALNETITVKKILGASGEFAPGVIQYAFTYYNKFGQESCIFYTTPLYYISFGDRGGNPEEKVDNAFEISIEGIDPSFEYLRIYSIQRTSLNGTPICKRVQDIYVKGETSVSFTDRGLSGDAVDPTELLYKGGETISAGTIEQKDGTLFLGDIEVERNSLTSLNDDIKTKAVVQFGKRTIYLNNGTEFPYIYSNQLTAFGDSNKTYSVPCCGFMHNNFYRCGVQFQHKSGKWSEPLYIGNHKVSGAPTVNSQTHQVSLPIIKGALPVDYLTLHNEALKDYVKVRPIIVFPNPSDRKVICQGVVSPTVYTEEGRNGRSDLYAQSSWFFRPYIDTTDSSNLYVNYLTSPNPDATGDHAEDPPAIDVVGVSPKSDIYGVPYTENRSNYDPVEDTGDSDEQDYTATFPNDIRQVEIQGYYNKNNRFKIDSNLVTLHSPDVDFDDFVYGYINNMEFQNLQYQTVGKSIFFSTLSSIDIQTETPQASNSANGIVEKAFTIRSSYGLISGLFYEDWVLNDASNKIDSWTVQQSPYKWMVYPWHRTGSLNNDINRPADKGTPTAILKKKVLSNLRWASTSYWPYEEEQSSSPENPVTFECAPQLFSSDQVSILKLGINNITSSIYKGNIDTILNPDKFSGLYFALGRTHEAHYNSPNVNTPFISQHWYKLYGKVNNNSYEHYVYHWKLNDTSHEKEWAIVSDRIGDIYQSLAMSKDSVRMKYKSSPHIVMRASSAFGWQPTSIEDPDTHVTVKQSTLPIVELQRQSIDESTIFGGESEDALKANLWIPCGEPVRLDSNPVNVTYLEDGTEVTKPCIVFEYSWGDTYFQRYDCLKTYPFTQEDINQVVEIGSFMLESYINIDGRYDRNRGQSNNTNMTPQNFNLINPVYSQTNNFFSYRILDADMYKNTSYPQQITWTKEKQSGAEIDLWTNVTLASIYNMDGTKGRVEELTTFKDQIFCFQNKGVSNILFNSRVQIPTSDGVPIEISNSYKVDGYRYISDGIGCNNKLLVKKTPVGIYFIDSVSNHLFRIADGIEDITSSHNMSSWFNNEVNGNTDTSLFKKLVYDDINHDVYAVKDTEALCFSETLNQFTGFYDYAGIDLIETCNHHVFTMKASNLWKMFENDDYCTFFGTTKPWDFTFISNGISEGAINLDKTFTNIEFRASVDGEGNIVDDEFIPYLPVDSLEVWNEHQHGITSLSTKSGSAAMKHYVPSNNPSSNLNRKFRIWRCDIPRDNYPVNNHTDDRGITRVKAHPMDRMRNPWLYLKFSKSAMQAAKKIEIHDINLSFFI